MSLTVKQVHDIAINVLATLPDKVSSALEDVDVIFAPTVEAAKMELRETVKEDFDEDDLPKALKELDEIFADELAATTKGCFLGAPMETEESEDGPDEIVALPEGSIILVAENFRDQEEVQLVVLHEVGHALGYDEDEIARLGLGVMKGTPDAPQSQPSS